ncbi:MAG: adenosylmethionine--8-amino-7-oxononanoate transaminase [Aphanocapsa feldmannii 288cV]|nr:MAG: adenosylmethionine--8-amino-7-oxononanoate transaminase [Aphanocapsa feldmannii 288cV]
MAPQTTAGWHPHLWHPYTQPATADPPLRVVAGHGAELELEDGRRLIDAISSWWVTLHGHGHPLVAEAIADQARRLEQVIFANFSHGPAERLAERLVGHWPWLERVFFSDNGSTAVEVCLKVALQSWVNRGEPRQRVVAFEGAYHGDTFGAMAVGARGLFSAPFEPLLFEVARAPWPATWLGDQAVEAREAAALTELERLLAQEPTAAVILEPLVQGAGGMAMVRPAFLQRLEGLVRQAGALLICDEVLVGFGRVGAVSASVRAGLRPDLVALSKGLTAGFLPMGVSLASGALYGDFLGSQPNRTLFHGHSFTANPLGCAAANASLDLLEHPEAAHRDFEARHRPRLRALAKLPGLQHPRLCGTIAALDLQVDRPGYLNQAGQQVRRACLEQGVFLRPLGHVLYLLPPLCLDNAQLDRCYEALAAAVTALAAT